MVPMHLGLIDGPFVPHNLISIEESPVPLLKLQMAPRLKILMASRSKKGTQIHFSFLSKVLQMNPLQVPQQGPYEERGLFTEHFAYLSKTSSFGFPSKDAPLKVPSIESLAERCPTTRPLLHSPIKFPGIRGPPPHTRFPSDGKGPPWRERCPYPETFLTYLPGSPVKEPSHPHPPKAPLYGASSERERDASSTEPPSYIPQSPQ